MTCLPLLPRGRFHRASIDTPKAGYSAATFNDLSAVAAACA